MELSRREFVGLLGTGALTLGGLGWSPEEAYAAAATDELKDFLSNLTTTAPAKLAVPYSTIVLVPDTQKLVQAAAKAPNLYGDYPGEIRKWIVGNRKTRENIKAVISLGDIVNDTGKTANVDYAKAQFNKAKEIYGHLKDLTENPVTTIALPGNHDYDKNPTEINRWLLNYEKYLKNVNSPWTGVWPGIGGEKQGVNAYYKLKLGDRDFIIITLEFLPRPKVVQWAEGVIKANKTKPIIIVTHGYQSGNGLVSNYDGYKFRDPFTKAADLENTLVKPHKNVLLVFSGHVHNNKLIKREISRSVGPKAFSFLADAQKVEEELIYGKRAPGAGYPGGGAAVLEPKSTPLGMIVIVRIANTTNSDGTRKVQLVYYSTARNRYLITGGEHTINIQMP
jgi:hypothetical protein